MANLEKDNFARAIDIVRMAVEHDEKTLEGKDDFDEQFYAPDYPIGPVHLVLNQSIPVIREVLLKKPDGRLAQLLKRSLVYITDSQGSHGYDWPTALGIYGITENITSGLTPKLGENK